MTGTFYTPIQTPPMEEQARLKVRLALFLKNVENLSMDGPKLIKEFLMNIKSGVQSGLRSG